MVIICKKALNVSFNFALYIVAIDIKKMIESTIVNADLGVEFHQRFSRVTQGRNYPTFLSTISHII